MSEGETGADRRVSRRRTDRSGDVGVDHWKDESVVVEEDGPCDTRGRPRVSDTGERCGSVAESTTTTTLADEDRRTRTRGVGDDDGLEGFCDRSQLATNVVNSSHPKSSRHQVQPARGYLGNLKTSGNRDFYTHTSG